MGKEMRVRRHLRLWRKRSRGDLRRLLILALIVALAIPMMAVPAVAAQTVGPLPPVDGLSSNSMSQDMLIFDRNGNLLADIDLGGDRQGDHRIVVPLSYISPYLVKATLAVEDKNFYTNSGVDFGSVIRAAFTNYSQHRITQGGSTISQQLVKQVFIGPNPPPTFQRKLREGILALQLNRRYSKDQILEMYLNTIYYGSQAYGVQAAARTFFGEGTDSHYLTLAQSAMLAGLPQAPTQNSPLLNPKAAKLRQAEVLRVMVEQKYITQAEADKAYAEPLNVSPPVNAYRAPHFVDYVLRSLEKDFNIKPSDRKGYRVVTTLDLNLQQLAERVIDQQIREVGNYYNFHDAALVSLDPKTGQILAMVGGHDYHREGGQINMATSASRQPGSSFKIFTYTAAIESRQVNMLSPILDEPLKFPIYGTAPGFVENYAPYQPQNYDRSFHGTLPLKMAMGNSLNIPALKVELKIGIPRVLDAARRMGVTSLGGADDSYAISLTLGGYEVPLIDMATGAATLGNMGVRHRPAPILTIKDGSGRQLFAYDPKKGEVAAVAPEVAFIVASIMSDDRNRCMSFGCRGDLTLPGRHVAAKTGTTESFRDNWTVGFTPSLATAVWVGNPDYKPLYNNSTGIVGAAPIWNRFMRQALANTPDQWYEKPAGVVQIGENYYLPGTENVSGTLARPWPTCPFTHYNPYALSWSQMLVDGVPCVLAPPPPPPPVPLPVLDDQLTIYICPPGIIHLEKCKPKPRD